MALKGGKGNFEMRYEVKRRLFGMLWAGNIQAAIKYLEGLGDEKVKCRPRLEGLVRYLTAGEPQIACCAARHGLGLRVSSNRVEKDSDLVVSSRQKHDGMGWSRQGGWPSAAIRALYLNRGSAAWLETGAQKRELNESYGKLFERGIGLSLAA